MISRISMVSCVNASTYGKAHTKKKKIHHINLFFKLCENCTSMISKLQTNNSNKNGIKREDTTGVT